MDMVDKGWKRYYLTEHENKPDKELMRIAQDSARAVSLIPANATSSDIAKGQQLLSEVAACQEILEKRKKNRDAVDNAIKSWESELQRRKESAILNLPYASSLNGQLVAAILEEEDGKTADEIRAWYDELVVMDDQEYQALLNGLMTESIIEKKGDRYYLKNICTADLFPSNSASACSDVVQKLICYIIEIWEKPLSENVLKELLTIIERYPKRYYYD